MKSKFYEEMKDILYYYYSSYLMMTRLEISFKKDSSMNDFVSYHNITSHKHSQYY